MFIDLLLLAPHIFFVFLFLLPMTWKVCFFSFQNNSFTMKFSRKSSSVSLNHRLYRGSDKSGELQGGICQESIFVRVWGISWERKKCILSIFIIYSASFSSMFFPWGKRESQIMSCHRLEVGSTCFDPSSTENWGSTFSLLEPGWALWLLDH